MYRPHVLGFLSSKDTRAMLVIGLSLPVVQYLWPFSRSSQPLLSAGSSAPASLLQTLSPCSHGAMGQCTCSCALGVGTSGYHLDHQNTHRYIQSLLRITLSQQSIEVRMPQPLPKLYSEAYGLRALEVYPGVADAVLVQRGQTA
jgi:hypothetical protein